MKYLIDTNLLLDNFEEIEEKGIELVITSHVLRELEKHKSNRDNPELGFRARRATRYIEANRHKFTMDMNDYIWNVDDKHEASYVDNMLIQACITNGYGIITKDTLLKIKADGYKIPLIEVDASEDETTSQGDYTGIMEIQYDDERLLDFYQTTDVSKNTFDLLQNQYLIIKDREGKMKEKYRWNGTDLVIRPKYEKVSNSILGDVRPRNQKQELLFNMLQDKTIPVKLCLGKFGSGKDYCMIAHAVNMLEKGDFDKIVYLRNPVPLKNSPESGFRKGDTFEKMIEYAMPLADQVGGVEQLRDMSERGIVELQDLSRIRGRDLRNSLIYVTEVQNNTREHIQLLLGRVGEKSQIWLNGDIKQTDADVFRYNSGIKALTSLRGNRLYGQVTLDKTERSETASLAELI